MNVDLALPASPPVHTAAAPPAITAASPLADQLTVVLLTYNCGHRLDRVLDQLLRLGLPVIAVDNGSSDDTVLRLTERAAMPARCRLRTNDSA